MIATVLPDRPGHVEVASIEGDGGRLTLEASKNCVGIAAIETLKLLGQTSCGVTLRLQKVRFPACPQMVCLMHILHASHCMLKSRRLPIQHLVAEEQAFGKISF